jgi:HSP20 family protein
MAKLHWTPWMALADLDPERGRMADEAAAPKECGYAWTPVADVVETPEEFRVTLELAGVTREEVTVEARGRYLVIQGERRMGLDPGGVYQVMERSYGSFSRRFVLPRGVSRHEITAVMKDGLLYVTVQKARPERLHRRIPIG